MNAEEQVTYRCSKCGKFFLSKDVAETCCVKERPCPKCGKPMGPFEKLCSACRFEEQDARQKAKEFERFKKAETLSIDDYDGEQLYDGEHFILTDDADIENAIDAPDASRFVWACTKRRRTVTEGDVREMLENILENVDFDDPPGVDDVFNVESLMKFVEQWNKKNGLIYFEIDYSRAVILKDPEEDEEDE